MYIHMTIFFTASYLGKKKYQKLYDLVRSTLKSMSVDLISPEEGNYQAVLDPHTRELITDPQLLHYEAIRQGIHTADVIIIEASEPDFQLGHEASLAMTEKKPVLVLSTTTDYGARIHHSFFTGKLYTPQTIGPILQDFLSTARERTQPKRFNMFLYPSQIEYLTTAGKRSGMNMSEYLRHLINLDKKTDRS